MEMTVNETETHQDCDPWPVRAFQVERIRVHPREERLTLVKLVGHAQEYIADRPEPGTFRYMPGDLVILYPEGCIMPRIILEEMHCWDHQKGRGTLGGNQKNRLTARKFEPLVEGGDRFVSPGTLRPCFYVTDGPDNGDNRRWYIESGGSERDVIAGTVVQDFLGIDRYVAK